MAKALLKVVATTTVLPEASTSCVMTSKSVQFPHVMEAIHKLLCLSGFVVCHDSLISSGLLPHHGLVILCGLLLC